MSWSVGAKGTSEQVYEQLKGQLSGINLKDNPSEEAIFEAVKVLLTNATIGQHPTAILDVSAYGSQSTYDWNNPEAERRITNSVTVKIESNLPA